MRELMMRVDVVQHMPSLPGPTFPGPGTLPESMPDFAAALDQVVNQRG